jgi:hypothetical protein
MFPTQPPVKLDKLMISEMRTLSMGMHEKMGEINPAFEHLQADGIRMGLLYDILISVLGASMFDENALAPGTKVTYIMSWHQGDFSKFVGIGPLGSDASGNGSNGDFDGDLDGDDSDSNDSGGGESDDNGSDDNGEFLGKRVDIAVMKRFLEPSILSLTDGGRDIGEIRRLHIADVDPNMVNCITRYRD